MNKKDIKIGDTVYWNTTGAFGSNISLKSKVVDIGKNWIWILVNGCLAYQNLLSANISEKPLYKVTNDR